ncbi:hypothetical protein BC826DRAFT_1058147 [Russula brevipes]|nr:hypothetical protein BC826DRAFT_1058147 [Russula brevipes]
MRRCGGKVCDTSSLQWPPRRVPRDTRRASSRKRSLWWNNRLANDESCLINCKT